MSGPTDDSRNKRNGCLAETNEKKEKEKKRREKNTAD